jgi:hypothetical protein
VDVRAVVALVAGAFLKELAGEDFMRLPSALMFLALAALVIVIAIVTRPFCSTIGLLVILLIELVL